MLLKTLRLLSATSTITTYSYFNAERKQFYLLCKKFLDFTTADSSHETRDGSDFLENWQWLKRRDLKVRTDWTLQVGIGYNQRRHLEVSRKNRSKQIRSNWFSLVLGVHDKKLDDKEWTLHQLSLWFLRWGQDWVHIERWTFRMLGWLWVRLSCKDIKSGWFQRRW